ncbi:glycoside hydrolase family 108 protein [Kushneria indalinina]|uniref:Putative peptidoglycan binding protein n=1 Tax=Kushneria indalinina DSM 14324 TaxID=1122140 RepID=A0A3D9DY87_9GAMM|nr:glycosyl hydrolase 108 family protein [Kushneria indalinina]REC95747.1 putative peptidoglycan binding protein [Kushneria indalinina DSM 14324]
MNESQRSKIILALMKREGGFVDHPDDRGGATNYGITQRVAGEHGYHGSMRDLTQGLAEKIYLKTYWHAMKLDEISARAPALAIAMLDYGVHSGTGRAGRQLQEVLNVLSNNGRRWPAIEIDGCIGTQTLRAMDAMLKLRGVDSGNTLASTINALRLAWLVELARRDVSQQAFAQGWIDRVVRLKEAMYDIEPDTGRHGESRDRRGSRHGMA